jgi:hypothetical protein
VQFHPINLMKKWGKKCVLLPEGYFVHHSYQLSSHVFAAHTMMQWNTSLLSFLKPLGRLLLWPSLSCWLQGGTDEIPPLQQNGGRIVTGQGMW